MPTPLLILSDSPASTSGLGRITRDLALRIHEHMSDVFKVGCLGCGGNPASPALPFPVYEIHDMLRNCPIFGRLLPGISTVSCWLYGMLLGFCGCLTRIRTAMT